MLMEEGVMEREIRYLIISLISKISFKMSYFREVFKMINQTDTSPHHTKEDSSSSEEGAHEKRTHG